MTRPIAVMAILLSLSSLIHGQDAPGINRVLQAELLKMGELDQEVRKRIGPLYVERLKSDRPSEEFQSAVAKMQEIDRVNFRRLEEIAQQHGWPGNKLVGEQACESAFLVLQHAPLEQQKQLLPLLRRAVAKHDARAADLAMLEDRVLTNEGKNQLYGTQIVAGPDGKLRVHTVDDPASLDSRRKEVGLPPMEEYLKRAEADMGASIERGNLKTN